ncbi:cytochrome c [Thiobacillus sedimenti]|uniref:Cytochrome c n=1 Tax=Thiobacillus sedimenti TaxID=3110231 RepID=A0ABZ1CQR4_9PROT|nr:cytochrome c [Thiobacillus sp. SCUT-2]WRS40677.1 cytochrome c [Thiobacillus sp. SCUT-2]
MTMRFLLLMMCAGFALPAGAQDAMRGKTLFEANCSRCHRNGAADMRTPLAELPAVLASRSVRAHRFRLSEAEVNDIAAYLAAARPSQ